CRDRVSAPPHGLITCMVTRILLSLIPAVTALARVMMSLPDAASAEEHRRVVAIPKSTNWRIQKTAAGGRDPRGCIMGSPLPPARQRRHAVIVIVSRARRSAPAAARAPAIPPASVCALGGREARGRRARSRARRARG